jgi:hypothetical protein
MRVNPLVDARRDKGDTMPACRILSACALQLHNRGKLMSYRTNVNRRGVVLLAAAVLMLVIALVGFTVRVARADDAGAPAAAPQTYVVQEGAFPWYDRTNWSLTKVPDSLKGSGPVPQQSCSSRSLVIDGTPKKVLIGVCNNDITAFQTKVPTAKATTDTIAVKNASGTEIDYTVFSLDSPPAKIDGTGVYGAGLMLLKVFPAPSK